MSEATDKIIRDGWGKITHQEIVAACEAVTGDRMTYHRLRSIAILRLGLPVLGRGHRATSKPRARPLKSRDLLFRAMKTAAETLIAKGEFPSNAAILALIPAEFGETLDRVKDARAHLVRDGILPQMNRSEMATIAARYRRGDRRTKTPPPRPKTPAKARYKAIGPFANDILRSRRVVRWARRHSRQVAKQRALPSEHQFC
jgi:hypothetical protein